MEFESHSDRETYQLGRDLGRKAQPGQVICLNGDMGTGKTVFTKGFAEGLGISETVNSPTFTILSVYEEGRIPLYHFDVYRIGDPWEMDEIGFDEYVDGDGVCLIEWADQIRDILPPERMDVRIEKDLERGWDYRRIKVTEVRP